jgi:2'-5' RNA ligase
MMSPTPEYKTPVAPKTLSGALGLAIIPDQATIKRAYALAEEIMPKDAQYVLSEGSLPHLILYHGKLEGIPESDARDTLRGLQSNLLGQKFVLKAIVAFGGNFIFWNVDPSSSGVEVLQRSHSDALSVARYLAKSSVAKAVSEEALSLTDAELENVRLFGHPLVRSLYTPHITLGFHPGISDQLACGLECDWSFEVESVEVVKIGYPGRVEEIVDLVN